MARVSMGDVWDDAKGFVRREAALLLPVALATLGLPALLPGLLLRTAAPLPAATPAGDLPAGLDPAALGGPMFLLLIVILLTLLWGQLAICALALTPRASVSEALAGAARRVPGALLASLLSGLAMLVVLTVASLIAGVMMQLSGGGVAQAQTVAIVAALPGMFWLFVRLTPLLPMLAAMPPTLAVIAPFRRAFAMTRGQALGIAGAALAFFLCYLLIVSALQFAFGSIFELAARALGGPKLLGLQIAGVLAALVGAALQMVWVVFQALLYRRLAGRG